MSLKVKKRFNISLMHSAEQIARHPCQKLTPLQLFGDSVEWFQGVANGCQSFVALIVAVKFQGVVTIEF